MIYKDFAYSKKQLHVFLLQAEQVIAWGNDEYSYKNACIFLEEQSQLTEIEEHMYTKKLLPIVRCAMYLFGDPCDIDAFYKDFLIQHMTMGG